MQQVDDRPKTVPIRLSPEILAYIHQHQQPRETYDAVLRRLLGIEAREREQVPAR